MDFIKTDKNYRKERKKKEGEKWHVYPYDCNDVLLDNSKFPNLRLYRWYFIALIPRYARVS